MNSADILQELDRRAAAFEFPVLDNANAHFIAGRFRGFRAHGDWALAFEVLVFAPQERAIVTDVYVYGPLAGDGGWALIQVGGVQELPSTPLWDADGFWIVAPGVREVDIGTGRLRIACGVPAKHAVGLDRAACKDEVSFTRALLEEVGLEALMPLNMMFDLVPGLAVAEELFRLTNWDHPDVAGDERPSASLAIEAAARIVAGESSILDYDHSRDNLDSSRWDER
jgi:hypothetical protein